MPADRHGKDPLVRPFGFFKEAPPLHFWMLQAVAFLYIAYRFASRNYTVYGFLDAEFFDYATSQNTHVEFWPRPLIHFFGTQFIYGFLPHPSPDFLRGMQMTIIGICLCGAVGIFPRFCAWAALLLALHIKGLMIMSNAMTDGGTMAMAALFVVAVAPANAYYRIGKRLDFSRRSADYHWPLALFFMFIGAFYAYSGINKIAHYGPIWPFKVHLENLSRMGIERSMFVSSRFTVPEVSAAVENVWFSHVSCVLTLIGEIGFIGILFLPRWRFFLVASMIILHHLVLFMQGINFIGSSFLVLLCLDWNAWIRGLEVVGWGKTSERWRGALARIGKGRLKVGAPESNVETLTIRDENGEVFQGFAAIDQVLLRRPILWPVAALLRTPGIYRLAKWWVRFEK